MIGNKIRSWKKKAMNRKLGIYIEKANDFNDF